LRKSSGDAKNVGQETFEELGFDRPVDQPGVVELNCVVPNAPIQRE
jgi:hypothetical protein